MVLVQQVGVQVYLPLDPGGEVCDVAVDARSKDLAEAHAAPGGETEQGPAAQWTRRILLLTHQRTPAVALDTHAHA